MQVLTLPALADNWIHILVDRTEAAAVDPGASAPVLAALCETGATLRAVLLTHRHADHTAGAAELRAATGCAAIGPAECAGVGLDRTVGEGDAVACAGTTLRVLGVPGHTRGHVAYFGAAVAGVWTGDTLFPGGCGRILEGTAAELWAALCRLRELPPNTRLYSGHDYTLDNWEFAASVLPDDPAIAARLGECQPGARLPTGAPTIGEERRANIFLRSDTPAVRRALGLPDAAPAAVFAELRRRKDAW